MAKRNDDRDALDDTFGSDAPTQEESLGNSAGNEPAKPGGTKHAAHIGTQLRKIATTLYLASEVFPQELQLICEEASEKLETIAAELYFRRVEERERSGKAPDGAAPENAQKVTHRQRLGGVQLNFSLYCLQCGFEVWSCPECQMVRCRCARCQCVLDKPSGSN